MIAPGDELSGSVDTALEVVETGGAIVVVVKIVFARPKKLYGNADLLGNGAGFEHVVVGEAAAKTTPGALHVHDNVVVRNAENFSALHAARFGSLARRPEFEFAVVIMRQAILRLHRCVREERIRVGGFHDFRSGLQRGIRVTVLAQSDRGRLLREFVGALLKAFAALLRRGSFVPLRA